MLSLVNTLGRYPVFVVTIQVSNAIIAATQTTVIVMVAFVDLPSGLTTLGLPRTEIPLALLLFNVGVEAGQLFFVVLILLLARAFKTLQIRWPRWAEAAPAYTIGGLGAYWTIQRTLILLAR